MKILSINSLILYFCAVTYDYTWVNFDLSTAKNQIAAFLYANTFLIIYLKFKSNDLENNFRIYAKYLTWTSVILIELCYMSLIFALIQKNTIITLENVKNLFLFSRADTIARSMFIFYTNPVGFLLQDYQNMKMIGPQLLINPFILFLASYVRADFFKKDQVKIILISTIPLFLALNSRALALTIVLLLLVLNIKNIKTYLHFLYIVALTSTPLLITTLASRFLNGRQCQIDFVRSNLTMLGNGIGSKQNELNALCGDALDIHFYQTIKSITYDNIHIEALHYFGYLPYFVFLICLLYKGISLNSYQTRIWYALTFVFFSLNLNLFEIYFIPIYAMLFTAQSINNSILQKQAASH